MSGYQKIIVAVDFSHYTDTVFQRALQLAMLYHAHLTVVHVVDYAWPVDVDYVVPPADDTEDKLVKAAQLRLEALGKATGTLLVERRVLVGRPKQEIHTFAEQEKVDLIVMGAHGHHGLHGLLGSTTGYVTQRANCDVLVVHHDAGSVSEG